MLIDETSAYHFIHRYQALLEAVAELKGMNRQKQYKANILLMLAHARMEMVKKSAL